MFLSSRHELLVLFGTFLGGIAVGVVFDFFRIMRKNFRITEKHVWLQDILMWACILAVVYSTLYITNSAQIRWYEFLGFGAGVAVYMTTLSRWFIKVSTAVITLLKKLFSVVLKFLIFPFMLISKILSPVVKLIVKLQKRFIRKIREEITKFYKILKKK